MRSAHPHTSHTVNSLTVRPALFLLVAAVACGAQAQTTAPTPPTPSLTMSPAAREALGLATDAAASVYAEGRVAQLALRFGDARDAYRRLAADAGPASAFGLESTALWAAMLSERDADLDRFYAVNDSLAEVAGAMPDGPSADWLRATAALHRAVMLARQERYPRAGLAFRDACGRFRALTRRSDAAPDALFGQGVCEVAAGSVPRKYRWLTRLVGFSGTVAGGMEHLAAAADGGGAQADEATAVFAVIDQTLNGSRADGAERLRTLAAARPGSPVLAYLDGFEHFTDRDATAAEAAFRRAQAALDVPGTAALPTVSVHLGLTLFRQDRFAEAAPLLDTYVRDARGQALVAQAALYGGIAWEMTGDRRRAEALYRRVRATRDYDTDLAAAREAERRLSAPMTDTERHLVLGATAFDGGRYEEAVSTLQTVVAGGQASEVERAEAAYRSGRALQELRRWDDALRHYRLAIDRPGDPLARWGPWARFYTGETLARTGDAAGARAAYQAILANEAEFDFSKALEQRTRAALERLDRAPR